MPPIRTEAHGAVLSVHLARPEKKNALTSEMYTGLVAALDQATKSDDVRAVRLIGDESVFTAGNDLFDFLQNPPAGGEAPVFKLLMALVDFAKPIVAAVDGPAVGIGVTLLLHCDLVVATTRARFRMPFVPLGVVPEAGSSVLLPAVVGMQRASEWLLLGDGFDAAAARDTGLVNRVVEAEALDATSLELATALASRPPEALRLTKKLLRDPEREAIRAAIGRESALFVERLQSPEAIAAFTAFTTKKS